MKIKVALGTILLATVAATVGAAYLRQHQRMINCADRGEQMHMEAKFSKATGCYVLTPHGWRPVSTLNIEVSRP